MKEQFNKRLDPKKFGIEELPYTPSGIIAGEGSLFRGIARRENKRAPWIRWFAVVVSLLVLLFPGLVSLVLGAGQLMGEGGLTSIGALLFGLIFTVAGFIGLYANIRMSLAHILTVVALVVIAGAAWYTLDSWKPDITGLEDDVVAGICPQDAMQCPDGSYVSRMGTNCEFAECPTLKVERDQKNTEVKNVEVDDRYNIDTSGWKTYRNEEYGFEFKYPPGWVYREIGDDAYAEHGFGLDFGPDWGKDPLLGEVHGVITLSVIEAEKGKYDATYTNGQGEKININGIDMLRFWNKGSGAQAEYDLYFEHNDLLFIFGEGFFGKSGDKAKIEALHSTFKFLP